FFLFTGTGYGQEWKEAIVYQIYPRSFKDSDRDGVGDWKGILSKMDYIKSLGVTMVWLNPMDRKPKDDNDLDALVKGLHARGLQLLVDTTSNAFDAVNMSGYSVVQLKQLFSRWDSATALTGWPVIYLGGHDQARLVSRFGNDRGSLRSLSSK